VRTIYLVVDYKTSRKLTVCANTGHEASSTVYLINGENEPLNFSIVDSSCQAAGYTVRVVVEPMQGVVPPKSK